MNFIQKIKLKLKNLVSSEISKNISIPKESAS